MRLALKIGLAVLAVIVLLVGGIVLYLAVFFDANQFKGTFASLVQKKTGRSFSIESIHVAFYPTLGLQLTNATLGNAPAFGSVPFAQIGKAEVGVQILPLLLHHEVRAKRIYLSDVQANLQKDATGHSNWEDLAGKPKNPSQPEESSSSPISALAVNVEGVDIEKCTFTYSDAQAHRDYAISDFALTTGTLIPNQPVDMNMSLGLKSDAPALQARLTLKGNIVVDTQDKHDHIAGFEAVLQSEGVGLPQGIQRLTLGGDLDYQGVTKVAHFANAHIEVDAQGPEAPSGLQRLLIAGDLVYQGDAQTAHFSNARVEADTQGPKAPAGMQRVVIGGQLDYLIPKKIAHFANARFDIDAAGPSIPGGKQHVVATGNLAYDGSQGTASLANGRIAMASLNMSAGVTAAGLNNANTTTIAANLHVDPFDPRKLLDAVGKSAMAPIDPTAMRYGKLDAQFSATPRSASLHNLVMQLDQSHINGQFDVTDIQNHSLTFSLKIDQIDVDRFATKKPAAPTQPAATATAHTDPNATPIPVEMLDSYNANGSFGIGKLKVKNLWLSNVQLTIAARRGGSKREQLSADLYSGHAQEVQQMDMGTPPRYTTQLQLQNVNAGALLKDLSGKDRVTGIAQMTMNTTSNGTTLGAFRRSMNGTVSLKLSNGSVKGVDLANIVQQGQSLLNGQLPTENSSQQTQFSNLEGSGKIVNGVLNDSISGASPLLRLTGSGSVDLVNMTLDYVAKPTIVNTLSGQGGKSMDKLRGIAIPVHFTGSLSSPHYSLDVKAALEDKLKQGLQQVIQQKLGGGGSNSGQNLGNQLKSLFGGQH